MGAGVVQKIEQRLRDLARRAVNMRRFFRQMNGEREVLPLQKRPEHPLCAFKQLIKVQPRSFQALAYAVVVPVHKSNVARYGTRLNEARVPLFVGVGVSVDLGLVLENAVGFVTEEIGEIALKALKEIDSVAYVRFASVYKDFGDVESFISIISELKEKDSIQGILEA